MDLHLTDKVAIVTGGSRGIGKAVAFALARDAVAFLASPRSVAVTGDAIAAGGGRAGAIYY